MQFLKKMVLASHDQISGKCSGKCGTFSGQTKAVAKGSSIRKNSLSTNTIHLVLKIKVALSSSLVEHDKIK